MDSFKHYVVMRYSTGEYKEGQIVGCKDEVELRRLARRGGVICDAPKKDVKSEKPKTIRKPKAKVDKPSKDEQKDIQSKEETLDKE